MSARFSFWGTESPFEKKPYYLHDETKSTVTDTTLHGMGEAIPWTPTLGTWKLMTEHNLRCKSCWSSIDCLHGQRKQAA